MKEKDFNLSRPTPVYQTSFLCFLLWQREAERLQEPRGDTKPRPGIREVCLGAVSTLGIEG